MKNVRILGLVSLPLFLVACTSTSGTPDAGLKNNPLYAEWYYNELTETMMNLEIQQHPIVKDPQKKEAIDAARQDALAKSQEAVKQKESGQFGTLLSVEEEGVGTVLFLNNVLYFGPDTSVVPGVELHVYVSPVIDPRTESGVTIGKFPDASAIDLGVFTTTYGASAYTVPANHPDLRTVVLWDKALDRIHSFAQLRKL